jgi:hypothetical protein
VGCPADNGFVDVHIAVPDFQVETAIRIGANPSLVMNRRPLTAKVRQRHQVSRIALQTLRKIFQEGHLPTEII